MLYKTQALVFLSWYLVLNMQEREAEVSSNFNHFLQTGFRGANGLAEKFTNNDGLISALSNARWIRSCGATIRGKVRGNFLAPIW